MSFILRVAACVALVFALSPLNRGKLDLWALWPWSSRGASENASAPASQFAGGAAGLGRLAQIWTGLSERDRQRLDGLIRDFAAPHPGAGATKPAANGP